jgi:hypothetical protein
MGMLSLGNIELGTDVAQCARFRNTERLQVADGGVAQRLNKPEPWLSVIVRIDSDRAIRLRPHWRYPVFAAHQNGNGGRCPFQS